MYLKAKILSVYAYPFYKLSKLLKFSPVFSLLKDHLSLSPLPLIDLILSLTPSVCKSQFRYSIHIAYLPLATLYNMQRTWEFVVVQKWFLI